MSYLDKLFKDAGITEPEPYDRERFVEGSLDRQERYTELTKNVSRYIEVRGMFEVKEGF